MSVEYQTMFVCAFIACCVVVRFLRKPLAEVFAIILEVMGVGAGLFVFFFANRWSRLIYYRLFGAGVTYKLLSNSKLKSKGHPKYFPTRQSSRAFIIDPVAASTQVMDVSLNRHHGDIVKLLIVMTVLVDSDFDRPQFLMKG